MMRIYDTEPKKVWSDGAAVKPTPVDRRLTSVLESLRRESRLSRSKPVVDCWPPTVNEPAKTLIYSVIREHPRSGADGDSWSFLLSELDKGVSALVTLSQEKSEAINHLDALWSRLEQAGEKVESAMRLLLATRERPILGELPVELRETFDELIGSAGPERSAVLSAKRLLQMCLAVPEIKEAQISPTTADAPLGGVEIDWSLSVEYRWIVLPSSLAWPGINCRAYFINEDGSAGSARFHVADAAIKHLMETIGALP